MWTVEKVQNDRMNYLEKKHTEAPSEEEYMYKIKDMANSIGMTDERLKHYIYNLRLDDKKTAEILDYVDVPTDNKIESFIRIILGFIWILCFPILIACFILKSTTAYEIKYNKKGAPSIFELFIQTLLSFLFSFTFIGFLWLIFDVQLL